MSKLKSIREIEMERAAQPNFGKGISVASGFDLGAKSPLDSRLTVKTIEERNAHVTGNRAYEGMLVYVEADKKTYQLINNVWEEFGFNEEKFQAGIKPLVDKNTEQDQRLKSLEDLVVGGEGEGLESIIADVAANKAAIAKEIEDRQAADSALETKISEMDAAYKNADTAIKSRLDALEGATADLEQIRTDIEANESAIAKEVQDRIAAVSGVDSKLTAEISRATQAEEELAERLNVIEGEGVGSIKKALADAKADATAKSAQALEDAKAYTDEKISEANNNVTELENKVQANTTALGLVDGKISTAKTEAIDSAKAYTNSEITKIDTAYKAADVQVLEDAKADATSKVNAAKLALEGSINAVDGKVTTLTGRVSANETAIADLRDVISNKNSNTIVVNTEAEIADANPEPKIGDLAFVIDSKRAYIFKGVEAASVKSAPAGWVVFDEITNELDLVDYLKISDAEVTYRKLADKIAEDDLESGLATKINNKADKSYVDNQISTVNTGMLAMKGSLEGAIADCNTTINRNFTTLNQGIEIRHTQAKEYTDEKVSESRTAIESSLTEKETALKAEDAKLNNRINKFAPVVSADEPVDTEAGHVWLQLG